MKKALRSMIAEIEKELVSLQKLLAQLAVVKPQNDVIARRANRFPCGKAGRSRREV